MYCDRCGRPVRSGAASCPRCGGGPVKLSTPRPRDLPPTGGPGPSAPPGPSGASGALAAIGNALSAALGAVRRFVGRLPVRMRLLLAGALVLVLVLACGGFTLLQRVAFAPQEPVEELAAAFADGDLGRAAKLAGCVSRICQPGNLRQGYRPPTDLRVVDVAAAGPTEAGARPDLSSAYVRVRYRLGGQQRESSIRVHRPNNAPFRNWTISAGATRYLDIISSAVPAVQLGGATVSTLSTRRIGGGRGGAHEALLGVYTLGLPADEPLLSAGPTDLTVGGDERGDEPIAVELALAVKPGVAGQVDALVKEYVDQCARQAEFAPRRCPFAYHKVIYKPGPAVGWRIDDYPRLELGLSGRPAADKAPITVRTVTPGHATVSYTSDGAPYTATVEYDVRGLVYVDQAGKIAWTG